MKKKLYLLAAFIALNVAAQPSLNSTDDALVETYAVTEPHRDPPRKASIHLRIDVKKELLKVRSTLPINELSINDLYGKNLLRKRDSHTLHLASLTRGVYELVVKVEGTTFRKRMILQ